MIKPIKKAPVATRRKFAVTFKRQAVGNWLASGKSAEVIAQELGLTANLLYAWKKCFAPEDAPRASQGAKPGAAADLQSRLEAAHRELARPLGSAKCCPVSSRSAARLLLAKLEPDDCPCPSTVTVWRECRARRDR